MPRNAAGVYSLPNPPVAPDTTIESTDENDTRDDIASELTNSLDRNGRGGMLAPFRISAGTLPLPGLAFSLDQDCGIYRSADNTWHLVTAATLAVTLATTGVTVHNNFTTEANTTIGNAIGDTLTLNAGTVTIGNLQTVTQAAGTVAAGTVVLNTITRSFTGDAGGTTSLRGYQEIIQNLGANPVSSIYGSRLFTRNSGTGLVSSGIGFASSIWSSGAGGFGTCEVFYAEAPTITAGTIGTLYGFRALNQGNASVTTATGFICNDFTNSTTMRAFHGEMSSGSGKFNLYMSGTADNILAGNVRIGSTVAPTVALDVTGAVLISSNLGVTGAVTGGSFSGPLNGTVGATTPAAGTFTDLTVNGNTIIGNASTDTLTFHPNAWTLTNAVTVTGTWTNLGTVTTVTINGGTITGITDLAIADGGTGASTAATAFNNLKQAASDTATGVLEIAIQSEMEAASSPTLAVVPGRMQYHPGVSKAWIFYNYVAGVPTIQQDYGVSSLTDNGTGDATINFTTAFSSAEYCFEGSGNISTATAGWLMGPWSAAPTASAFRAVCVQSGGGPTDGSYCFGAFFGDQ